MRFVLRKDRMLVLRAKDLIRLEISHPENAEVNIMNTGFEKMTNAVIILPSSKSLIITEPFAGDPTLPKVIPIKPSPVPSAAPSSSP